MVCGCYRLFRGCYLDCLVVVIDCLVVVIECLGVFLGLAGNTKIVKISVPQIN